MNKTKKAISNGAIKIFSYDGYKGATMDDIALEAGVAKGTLYYNFNSKEEIFNYIVQDGINKLKEDIYETKVSNLSPINKLKRICRIQLNYLYKNKDFSKIILSQLWGSEKRQENLRNIINEYIKDIKTIIDDAIDQKLISESNSSILANAFFGCFTSAAIYDMLNSEIENIESVIETTLEFTLRGIGLQTS
ncbi:TetR/AcrR family transcriptional regulator [Clostridium sp. LP20]|uniref:TetR/AcrR family transcriptional regulator n=1 Tax=Clostridium sp. LP20 TaxID=3418665 RepID=UPI003EE66796